MFYALRILIVVAILGSSFPQPCCCARPTQTTATTCPNCQAETTDNKSDDPCPCRNSSRPSLEWVAQKAESLSSRSFDLPVASLTIPGDVLSSGELSVLEKPAFDALSGSCNLHLLLCRLLI